MVLPVYPMAAEDQEQTARFMHSTGCLPSPGPACWDWWEYDGRCAEQDIPGRVPGRLGMTDRAFLLAWHKGRCANCGRRCKTVCDHDHWSGLIRGWLCNSCNVLESTTRGGLASYCKRNPASMFKLRIVYPGR